MVRNCTYDFLRFLGIICILFAHSGISGIWFQLRNFDVPLLVILSGMAYAQYSSLHYSTYLRYVKDRFVRLIIPTWIFLILYYILFRLDTINSISMIEAFLLYDDKEIGIWIIRIFFSMALIAPFLYRFNKKITTDKQFYILVSLMYVMYVMLLFVSKKFLTKDIYGFFELFVLYTISYGLIYLYGIRLINFSKKTIKIHIVISLSIFILYIITAYVVYHKFYPTQKFKYPPQGYYIAYAFFISLSLYYVSHFTTYLDKIKCNKFITFIGSSTLWIYLWHWIALKLLEENFTLENIFVKFIFIFSFAILFSYIQREVVYLLIKKISLSDSQIKLIKKIFIG